MSAPSAIKRPPRKTKVREVKIRENLPVPSTAEGELFHYNPDETALWLPFSARKLKEMAYSRQVPHVNNGNRIWFSGLNIRAISEQFTVAPFEAAA